MFSMPKTFLHGLFLYLFTVLTGFNEFGFNESSRFSESVLTSKVFLLHRKFGFNEYPGLSNNRLGPALFVKSGDHCICKVSNKRRGETQEKERNKGTFLFLSLFLCRGEYFSYTDKRSLRWDFTEQNFTAFKINLLHSFSGGVKAIFYFIRQGWGFPM